jgi:Mycothiol maleylpyruvate isomerase N-terminal domain
VIVRPGWEDPVVAIRDDYLSAADAALTLLREPEVAVAWDRPSALDLMTVGALAAHLSRQIVLVPDLLTAPPADEPPIPLLQHYAQVKWRGADLDNETNTAIRAGGDAVAQAGLDSIIEESAAALERSRSLPTDLPGDRAVVVPWTGWPLRMEDLLVTRLLEIVVHCDDLAYSVDIPTPEFTETVIDRVVELLARLAVQRHGATSVVRALSRSERAPKTIAAI